MDSSTISLPDRKRQLDVPESHDRVPKRHSPDPVSSVEDDAENERCQPAPKHSQSQQLCHECDKIDIDAILGMDSAKKKIEDGRKICSLDHIRRTNKCSLCQFFCQMKIEGTPRICSAYSKLGLISTLDDSDQTSKGVDTPNSTWNLWAFSAKSAFVIKSTSLDETIMLGVAMTPKNDRRFASEHRKRTAISRFILPSKPEGTAIFGKVLKHDEVDYDAVTQWLSFCFKNHKCHSTSNINVRGLLLIDCDSRRIVRQNGGMDRYVTLSYLWGPNPEKVQGNIGELPALVPKVMEDAIQVVLRLNFRYLWVDRYCIPQGNGSEKHEQIKNMGNIYANAVLTIIASAGGDSSYGLPGVSTRHRTTSQPQCQIGSNLMVSSMPNIKTEIGKSKWNSRGWTYQEALVSTRRLVFTDSQVYFQCASMHCLESLALPLNLLHTKDRSHFFDSINLPRVFPNQVVGKHTMEVPDRIEDYNRRQLSFETDALDAFQGILQSFKSLKHPVENFLGLPLFPTESFVASKRGPVSNTDKLALSLMWTMNESATRRRAFPSWTWLGWKGHRFYINDCRTHLSSSIAVIERVTYPISVSVEFEAGVSGQQFFQWEEDYTTLLTKADAGQFPRFLHISAFVLPIRCTRRELSSSWKIRFPGWGELVTYGMLDLRKAISDILKAGGKDDLEQSFFGLMISHHLRQDGQETYVRLFIVRADHEGNQYERYGDSVHTVTLSGFNHNQDKDTISFRNLELQRKTIKLG
jgi:hypothetical protein